ncbi:Xylose isomerase domain protein TIM barrel [Methanothermus fervidus DSM 2088]|uniref:Xylose isomerase domain protein TIM barrel n=1 Tax=Methanothermus fervidus (strain ATCC 43054 / DSM 2088 / JCM 10308 / V24 S) TaxID=523846 RepID=E3GYJ1_METFV|nr:TIM barrel protein [Methanothermus fervidus]ADP77373.1 Xylose isomerase domain protein TIM barrel [Methanothermus fervidus DSM 2088]
MKLGFSTLALIPKPLNQILKIFSKSKFELLELLCDGPYWPRNLLKKIDEIIEIFSSYDLKLYVHAPTVDLNIASLNEGIRNESKVQIKESIQLAAELDAKAVTIHPGYVKRPDKHLRDLAVKYSKNSIHECQEYAEEIGMKLCIENMPNRNIYLCKNVNEYLEFIEECNSCATIDIGHANTSGQLKEFMKIKACYHHINDNDGKKDQHLPLGEGNIDLKYLKFIKNGIIEVNDYKKVLKCKEVIQKFLRGEINGKKR